MNRRGFLFAVVTLLTFGTRHSAWGDSTVSIAAAANLVHALEALNAEFKRTAPGIKLTSATGASGSLFAQIKNGAPFDVFLSADVDYPRALVEKKLGDTTTLRVFAIGRLVLWTTRVDLDISDVAAIVRAPTVRKIAVAQPKTAPYGRATLAALDQLGLRREAELKIVYGESITQTAQFVETGNADAGFVALSLVLSPKLRNRGRWKEVPADWHASVPLDHAGVLTHRGAANPAAKRYLDFLASAPAQKILRAHGYGVPAENGRKRISNIEH